MTASKTASAGIALHTNFNVDFVISYRFSGTGTILNGPVIIDTC
jgi:hypothetical protein